MIIKSHKKITIAEKKEKQEKKKIARKEELKSKKKTKIEKDSVTHLDDEGLIDD